MKAPKDWQCQECGRRMTMKAAEKAMLGSDGCPGCGSSDIDLYVEDVPLDGDAESALASVYGPND